MTETSCAIAAASQIAPLCDYADLDGSHLIAKNLFEEIILSNGKIKLQKKNRRLQLNEINLQSPIILTAKKLFISGSFFRSGFFSSRFFGSSFFSCSFFSS